MRSLNAGELRALLDSAIKDQSNGENLPIVVRIYVESDFVPHYVGIADVFKKGQGFQVALIGLDGDELVLKGA